ncbi:RCC1/BLIP-II protein [Fistulina hepatica ATCC 64428]|uniref:RCC1/BLIP-II protein n=1 Tax=Fistulina hepatica ATCC 64428 TaxID=1128425 RepID=A0A0D7AB73_9AGAR|nr:RCC1/BLIP-II protein [Fistulina hepatica ATCC 64428]
MVASRKRKQKDKSTTSHSAQISRHATVKSPLSPSNGDLHAKPNARQKVRHVPFNSLLAVPAPRQPPLQLIGWGEGDCGQLGFDIPAGANKPKRNTWVERMIEEGQFGGQGAGLVSVAAGGMHSLFVDEAGSVWSFGINDDAALGRKTIKIDEEDVDMVTKVPTSLPGKITGLVDEGFHAVKVFAGDSLSLAISETGQVRSWGCFRGNGGVVGFSPNSQLQFTPISVLDLKDDGVVSAAIGDNYALLLTASGHIYTFGCGEEGQLGRRVLERRKIHGTVPERVVLGTRRRRARVIGAGANHSFATDEDGIVWAWGVNSKGQTGTGVDDPHVDAEVRLPKRVLKLSKGELGGATVVQIAGGNLHTLFLTNDGDVYACGLSSEGQLGLPEDHPAFRDRPFPDFLAEPTRVPFPDSDDPVEHISCGTHNNMAVTRSGALYSWGRQVVGELGVGEDDGFRPTPTAIVRREGGRWRAEAVSCGGQHCLALVRRKT